VAAGYPSVPADGGAAPRLRPGDGIERQRMMSTLGVDDDAAIVYVINVAVTM
jgi:hypothetical protein